MSTLWGREPALILGFLQAVLACALAFGVRLSPEQIGAAGAVCAAGCALLLRSKVSPVSVTKPTSVPPLPLLLLVFACSLLVACAATPRDVAVTVVNGAADFGAQAERLLEDLDRAEQAAALDQSSSPEDMKARIAGVRARYHKAFVAYRDFRAAWLAAASAVRAYDATVAVGATPAIAPTLALIKSLADAEAAFAAAADQIRKGQ